MEVDALWRALPNFHVKCILSKNKEICVKRGRATFVFIEDWPLESISTFRNFPTSSLEAIKCILRQQVRKG